MTFAEWYDSTIVPQLNETLKNVPVSAREPLRTASRQTMAACWNAAIEEAARWIAAPEKETEHSRLMANALHVTPINGEMRKFSQ